MAFHSATYFDLDGVFASSKKINFNAALMSVDGAKIPSGKDFDSTTGKIKDPKMLLLDSVAAEALRKQLQKADYRVASIEVKPFVERPKPPFTTSTLQQEANRKLGFTAKQTMRTAQSLYENGYITYMRTDSTTMAKVAVNAARDLVQTQYGKDFLHPTERTYASKVKNAQEAHEAIRPAGHPFQLPEKLRGELDYDGFRLFEMIWKRTIASQMADARKKRVIVTIQGIFAGGQAIFQASGTSIEFEGFLRAYVEGSDDPEAELAEKERLLPDLTEKEILSLAKLDAVSHTTQPPARFTEASLTQALEERGIGRPSTYASIIETIQYRDYVFKKGNALVPSWTAFAVIRLLEEHLGKLVNYQFTAQMEDHLDEISRNERGNNDYLRGFYFGEDTVESSTTTAALDGKVPAISGLRPLLASKINEIDPRVACSYPVGAPTTGDYREDIVVRVGRYGPFLEQGARKASIPQDLAPDEINVESALELLSKQAAGDAPLGTDPATGMNIYVKVGRYGPYIQRGEPDEEGRKNASLPKGLPMESVDLPLALKFLTLPRELGIHPTENFKVVANIGPFGPYVMKTVGKDKDYRSIPKDQNVLDISLDDAIFLLAQPKAGRGRAEPKPALKTFDESPITGKAIQLLEGKYGPYLADGETNASLPKDMPVDTVTMEIALVLLAERAAAGGSKKKKFSKKRGATTGASTKKKKATTKKKATPEMEAGAKTTTKKATKKKASKKKSASE